MGRRSDYIGLSHSPIEDLETNIDLPLFKKVYWDISSKKNFFWLFAPIRTVYRILFSAICFKAKPWNPSSSFTWLRGPEEKTKTQIQQLLE